MVNKTAISTHNPSVFLTPENAIAESTALNPNNPMWISLTGSPFNCDNPAPRIEAANQYKAAIGELIKTARKKIIPESTPP